MLKPRSIFIFLNVFLWLLQLIIGDIPMWMQVSLAVFLIALVGIPHGAIDHVLFVKNTKASPAFFYGFYLALITLIVLIWLLFPQVGIVLFLILSAYHFGQSQLSSYNSINALMKALLYFLWGSSILSALVVYNQVEIFQICGASQDLLQLLVVFQSPVFKLVLVISTLSFLLFFARFAGRISLKNVAVELLILGLIHLSFFTQSILIGFSIYFATLHSMEVLQEEFDFLKTKIFNFNFVQFIWLLMPYTLLSLFGIALLLMLSYFTFLPMSGTLIVFISISALTLPHSVVMEQFYSVLRKGSNV
tara:strand:+ start:130973 stop:131887 length:915 start_codon:yes stop_codon:yes gene_type:complete